ncbi:major facilitator superfamily domain, general substrate transporter [Diplogelasinospora grovesii]|uniref:Major facilitator superfamily domain, general substrate transporter n=1 Tax=Diplogelasinospora grovesii TaxID=303347 RepID=A0AAN6N6E0_9PEZI|nr:major facilitator superfamily domain, general substrate transporter [Diplogelasinospora grovesii]
MNPFAADAHTAGYGTLRRSRGPPSNFSSESSESAPSSSSSASSTCDNGDPEVFGSVPDPAATLLLPKPSTTPLIAVYDHHDDDWSLWRTVAIIFGLSGVTFSASVSTGLLTVGSPTIAADIKLPEHLLLWPSSAYSLACGCCLLLAGSVADRVGDRPINLLGSLTLCAFVLLQGFARSGTQLILFRTLQGVGVSMCLPTGVSIMTRSLPPGRARNIGFSCLGVAQPLGFSLGLVMEGAIEAAAHWSLGYYICAGILATFVVTNFFILPAVAKPYTDGVFDKKGWAETLRSLVEGIDWTGIAVSSVGLGLVSYTCAVLTENTDLLWQQPFKNMPALVLGLTLLVAVFPYWMAHQERMGKPALIPNSIWRGNRPFVAISVTVLLAWASLQSSELLASLFFQKVQQVTPLTASLRLLPSIVVGLVMNPLTGLCVQHFTAYKLLMAVSLIAAASPLIFALIDPSWSWWVAAFWAVALGPVSVDVLFTMAHLVITDVFPPHMHALAGAVFNTIAQLGTSLGMSLVAIVSSSVTRASDIPDKESPGALMVGYRAAFATCFVLMFLSAGTSLGLRGLGRLGTAAAARDGQ